MNELKTSLYDQHIKLGAKMVPFAHFLMPIQYTSIKDEVLAVREKVGVFDVSHMGEFMVEGPEAVAFVDYILTNDFYQLALNKAMYSPLCREDGKILDDLIAYKLSPQKVLVCVNASNIQKDWNWIFSQSQNFDIQLTNQSDQYSLLALQGPLSQKCLLEFFPQSQLEKMENYSVQISQYNDQEVIIARTGYTGEDGFEIFCSHKTAQDLWEKFLSWGVVPCGLGSRDVLRIEVCYPLYGQELTEEHTPLDVGLKWTVKLKKEKFIGKSSLTDYSPQYNLIKFQLDKGIPRTGYKVYGNGEDPIGIVTSGTLSPKLNKGIGLAIVKKNGINEALTEIFVDIRGRKMSAKTQKKPFL